MRHPSLAVFEHKVIAYRRSWHGSVLGSFGVPVLFLLGIGVSVGGFVDARGVLPIGYLDYVGPGLLAATAVQVAANESMAPVYASFVFARTYHAMRASPLRVVDILVGGVAYVLSRVLLAAAGFLVVLAASGAVHSAGAVAALPACALVALAVAAPSFAYAASVTHVGMLPVLSRLVVVPMTLFAGVFFPVGSLPPVARWLAYGSPLWHGVEVCRAATLGTPTAWGAGAHIAYLVAWCAAGMWLAHARFARKLADG